MRVGLTLPSFRSDASAVDGALRAEELGIDGVFAFDHLWPLGRPDRPALSAMPLLGAVAGATERISFGSLVARVGLLDDDVLVASLTSLHDLAGGRFIAGIGAGDRMSAAENLAYGIPFTTPEERLASVAHCASALADSGVDVWIGAGSKPGSPASQLAQDLGVVVNVWDVSPEDLGRLSRAVVTEVTWGGMCPTSPGALSEHLSRIADQGASWAVCTWPVDPMTIDDFAHAVETLRGHRSSEETPASA